MNALAKIEAAPTRFLISLTGSIALHAGLLTAVLFANENQLISIGAPKHLTSANNPRVHFVTFDEKLVPTYEGTIPVKDLKKPKASLKRKPRTSSIQIAANTPSSDGVTETQGDPHALSEYLYGLRRLIDERKIYPPLSRRMGETGKVLISLEVLKSGAIQGIQLKQGSLFARLDQAALEAVSAVEKYKPLPDSVKSEKLTVEVPIEYSL